MEKIPENPHERLIWLEHWGAEQRRQLDDRSPLRLRLRLRLGLALERGMHRLDPLLDWRLKTASNTFSPTGGHWVSAPTPWHILPRILRRIAISNEDVFVDFGCGTGRVVHQAAKQPLKRVIGLEVIPAVAQRARNLVNAQQHRYRCPDVQIVTCDVKDFNVPDDVTIAYLGQVQYLDGDELNAVLGNLIESIDRSPRTLRLIYYPIPAPLVASTGRFRLLPETSFGGVAIFESCGGPTAPAAGESAG